MSDLDNRRWFGGDNFNKVKRGSASRAGGVGDGQGRKRYGSAGTKRFRFNPNPTRSSSTSCVIMAQSKLDKAKYENSPRPVQVIKSGVK